MRCQTVAKDNDAFLVPEAGNKFALCSLNKQKMTNCNLLILLVLFQFSNTIHGTYNGCGHPTLGCGLSETCIYM